MTSKKREPDGTPEQLADRTRGEHPRAQPPPVKTPEQLAAEQELRAAQERSRALKIESRTDFRGSVVANRPEAVHHTCITSLIGGSMSRDEYSIDSNRRIRAHDSVFAPDAWNDLPTFDEALSAAGKFWLSTSSLGSRKEPWVSDLRTKYLLDIEEGVALVTGLNCRRGMTPFKWRGEKFYPIRPDFGVLLITTHFGQKWLTKLEMELHQKFLEHYDAVASLHHAIMHGEVDPVEVYAFDWWVEFWAKRGFQIQNEQPTGVAPATAIPMHSMARGSSGEHAALVFHTPFLTLPQVLVWILERDAARVQQVPENMLVSTLAVRHVRRCVDAASASTPIPADIDLSRLPEIVLDNAPPKDNKLRTYLTQRHVGPRQLPILKPESLAPFGGALLHYLGSWYAQGGKSKDDAEILARRNLRELDEWLVASGVQARLQDLVQQRIDCVAAGNAFAKKTWDDALAGILAALGSGRVKATGRRNGRGDPEPMPSHFWPQLTFRDREFKGRGLLTCACFKTEPLGDCWSDLWFDAHGILVVWPAKAESVGDTLSQAHDERTSQRQDAGSVGRRRRGRKPNKFEQVKEAMRVDLRQGRRTVADLQEMLEKDLAGTYGVSRDTARRARNAVVAEFDGNSIHDK